MKPIKIKEIDINQEILPDNQDIKENQYNRTQASAWVNLQNGIKINFSSGSTRRGKAIFAQSIYHNDKLLGFIDAPVTWARIAQRLAQLGKEDLIPKAIWEKVIKQEIINQQEINQQEQNKEEKIAQYKQEQARLQEKAIKLFPVGTALKDGVVIGHTGSYLILQEKNQVCGNIIEYKRSFKNYL